MRHWMLITGLSAVVAVSAWACGSDVNTTPGGTGTGGSTSSTGGAGGASVTSTTTSSTTTTGGGGFANTCEEACYKVEVECAFAGACGLISQYLGVDCGTPEGECLGQCLLDADCGAILSLVGQDMDPVLSACVFDQCLGEGDPCLSCTLQSCGAESQACGSDDPCSAFVQCSAACNQDQSCVADCAAANPSAATTAMAACIDDNCAGDCYGGAGGSGGSGGGGGAGGAAGGAGGAGGN